MFRQIWVRFKKYLVHSKMLIVDNNKDDKELISSTLNTVQNLLEVD